MKTINRAGDPLTRQNLKVGSIIVASFIRTFKGGLGLWCMAGPLIPFAFFESNLTAATLSIGVAIVIYGLIIWKYRTGSSATIGSIFRDAGLGIVFSLLGGLTVAALFDVHIGGGALLVTWGGFFILEWRNRLGVPLVTKAA